jgi:DNA-binding CsgD family transcriptional regulator
MASDAETEQSFREAHALAAPELIRKLYQSRPVVRLPQVVAGGYEQDPGYRTAVDSGKNHVTVALGVDPSGIGCALTFVEETSTSLTRETRRALERISAHLGSARRLRGAVGTAPVVDEADAVLSAEGVVLHAGREARAPEARHALREAARRVDRARCASKLVAPGDALGLWRALVDGRWSLVERFDSDGRRMFVAHRNDPSVRPATALSENERKVVALLALGHSVKLCGYELGFAQSTVSGLARSAMNILGVRSRAELADPHGAIIAASEGDAGRQHDIE